MSVDSLIAIAWDVLKCVAIPVKRQFGYVWSSKRYAQDLQKEVEKLAYDTERVLNAVEEARNNLLNIYSQVTEWQENAEKALKEARNLLRDFEMVNKTCCHGTLPDPSCRYQFSRKAKDKIEGIKELARECSTYKDVSFTGPPPGSVATLTPARKEGKDVPSTKLRDGVFESRALIIRDILDALADDNNSVVGVYGMGGVGKSTLLADAERRIREEKSFDLVAKADVSEHPDIKRIQGEIAHALGLNIKNEEYVSVRAELLQKRLENEEKKEKKVLIILDNLWKGLDLKLVGIPCGHDNKVKGCKLLLSSRDRDVLRREMGCDRDFLLGGLKEEEAKTLFESIVGDKVHTDRFRSLVDVTLHKCAGVPFLIVAIAKRFKDAGLSEWKDTLKQIEMSKDKGINEVIYKMLQLSYDNLEDEVKLTLRLCVVYGVSEPSLENLVRYGMGLGLYGQDRSIEEARNRLSSLLRTLQASSLLLENGDGNGNGFKIHDLVREFVASVTSKDQSLLVLKDKDKFVTELPKGSLKNCRAVSFPYLHMKKLPQELDCPELQVFLLFTNDKSLNIPDSLFRSMRKLMVLNLTGATITCSPLPFQSLENLYTLCLDGCTLGNVATIGELKGLRILSFMSSTIQRLPKEIGQLVELRLLDLNDCSQLRKIDPSVFRSLVNLEELYMEKSFDKWNVVEQTPPTNASLIELNDMKNLCTLHVSIPNPSALPDDLNVERLTKYKIQVGNAQRQPRAYKGSKTLELKFNAMSDLLQKGCIQTSLGGTDDLFLDGLSGIEQSICELSPEGFPKLKHLHVVNGPSIHYILRWPYRAAFKALESLFLEKLINLEKICHNHVSSKAFNTLKVVRVESCDKMEVLFPLSLLRELPQLEVIQVLRCRIMREIVEADDCDKVTLRYLRILELRNLPYINTFFISRRTPSSNTSEDQVGTQAAFFNGQLVSTPSLESLTMNMLPKLIYLWSDEFSLALNNLRSLAISQCKSLLKVINSASVVNLHKLQTLTIEYCVSVQEIFYLDGPSAGGLVETFSKLTTLNLWVLPSLRHIWNEKSCGIVRFHNLKQFAVFKCDNLRFVFFPSMVKFLANLRSLVAWNCNKLEAIIMAEEGSGMETSEILAFPMLTILHLKNLESFSCFYRRKYSRQVQSENHIKSFSTTLFNREVSLPSLDSLYLIELPKLKYLCSDEFPLGLSNLQSLRILACKSLSKVISFVSLIKLHKLHTLTIKECVSVEEIFNLDGPSASENVETLSELSTLELKRLPSLRRIWNKNPYGIVQLHNLTELEVSSCDNLRFMIFPSMVKSLVKLRTLRVRDCKEMEAIIIEEEGSGFRTSETLTFPALTNLHLRNLESFSCFSCRKCKTNFFVFITEDLVDRFIPAIPMATLFLFNEKLLIGSQEVPSKEDHVKSRFNTLFDREVAFPNLENLEIVAMGNIEMIWDNQVFFRHLKTLEVFSCNGLSHIFTPTIAGNLGELTKLVITNCIMLTEVIIDGGGEKGRVVTFKQLKYLELEGLTGLRCFSSGGYTLTFPLLEDFIVNDCMNMKFFSEGPVEAPKLDKIQVTNRKVWFWEGNLNITIQNMFEEMATIARLKKMRLSEFPKLIGKWRSELNPIKSSWRLESLMVDKCPSFINAIPSRLLLVLNNLHTLYVRDCELIEEIFDLEGLDAVERTVVLPSRRMTLDLVNLPKLRRLWNKDQEVLPYNFLNSLTLYKCSNLRHVFSPSMARQFGNLEKMEIKECGQMEGVIVEQEGHGSMWDGITFSSLRWLKLERLPNLTSFLSGNNYALRCPYLADLSIAHCPMMRSLTCQSSMAIDNSTPSLFAPQVEFSSLQSMALSHMDNLSKIWTDNPPESLTCEPLREMEIQNCKSLKTLFPHWLATSLGELQKLRVESCELEEIVTSGNDTPCSTVAQVLFPKLTSLVLHDMPWLVNFCPNFPILNWPSLRESQVTHCDKLNMMSFAAPMNKWTQKDHKQEVSDQQEHSSFEMDFPNLERLLLVNKDIQIIRDGKFHDDIFAKPKALILACFHDENAVFPPKFLLERFQNLRSLDVFCSSFEDIFPHEGFAGKGKHLRLENLKELKLSKLHNLKRVWREDYLVEKILQSIETFEVWDCPSLAILFPAVTSFQNLTELVVKNSSGLVHLMTFSAVTNLAHLTDMTIIGCERMKDVVANDRKGEGKVISLGKLKRLTLQHMRSLVCFSSTPSCMFKLPSLYYIEVEECPEMKIFSKGRLSTQQLRYARLFRYFWDVNLEGDLNTAIQKLSA